MVRRGPEHGGGGNGRCGLFLTFSKTFAAHALSTSFDKFETTKKRRCRCVIGDTDKESRFAVTEMAEPPDTALRRNVRAMRPHIDGGVSDLFRTGALAVRAMNTELSTRSIDMTQGVQPRMLNRLAAPGTAGSWNFPEQTAYASKAPGTS